MLTYKGKVLIKFKDKTGGKNKSEVDGFYRDSDGHEFFIKKPDDPRELFTELFAGLLLAEFIQRGLIPEPYNHSFICSDYIQLEDGSYALIQPKISFKELHKIIGTGNRAGSDRDALWEMFFGPSYYPLLTQLENYFGLSIVLMFSLLLGDYSVHSGNVVCLDSDNEIKQFARIDLGAAFRNFGYKENNINILYPLEYQGWLNPTGFTKGYFLNYKNIIGLFPAIAEKGKKLQKELDNELLGDIISTVLSKIPADFISDTIKEKLAKYMGIESFCNVSLGIKLPCQQFCLDLIEILALRLKKITELQDISTEKNKGKLYRSASLEDITTAGRLVLATNELLSFPHQLESWQQALASNKETILGTNNIHLSQLINQFNCFLNDLIQQVELTNHSQLMDSVTSQDGTMPSTICREAEFLRQIFTLNADGTPAFDDKKLEKIKRPLEPPWKEVEDVLAASFNTVVTIRIAQETENSSNPANISNYALSSLFFTLQEYLATFSNYYQLLLEKLRHSKPPINPLLFWQQNLQISPRTTPLVQESGTPSDLKTTDEASSTRNFRDRYSILTYQLQEKIKHDSQLAAAIAETKNEPLPRHLIEDLLVLKEFYDCKLAFNADNHLDNNYNESVRTFYKKALSIRLSDTSLSNQIEALIQVANQEFQQYRHVHILVDAMIMIGMLFGGIGLVAGIEQKALDRTLFFNSASITEKKPFESSSIKQENFIPQ